MKKTFFAAALLSTSAVVSAEVTGPIMLSIGDSRSSEVLAWSWGASQSGSLHQGGGSGAGKANVQDISITRYTDGQSIFILENLSKGEILKTAMLTRDNLTIRLDDVLITSYSVGSGGESKPNQPQTENISLNFRRVTTEIDGIAYCYDVALASPC